MIRFFKKKEKVKPAEVKKDYNPPTTSSRSLRERAPESVEVKPQPIPKVKEKVIGEVYRILKTPQVTEKATDLTKGNQYVFKVWPTAGKVEIKKAIEGLYGVDVISVKIIRVPAKRRRLGRIRGWRKGYKKAIVKIKAGQKIEVLPR